MLACSSRGRGGGAPDSELPPELAEIVREVDSAPRGSRLREELERIAERALSVYRSSLWSDASARAFRVSVEATELFFESGREPELFERFFLPGHSIPMVYLSGQGFNFHPINALNYATELIEYEGDEESFVRVMEELSEYVEVRSIDGRRVGLLPHYFSWVRGPYPWYSSISQGLGAGYMAMASRLGGGEDLMETAELLVEAFFLPPERGGVRVELGGPVSLIGGRSFTLERVEGGRPFYVEYSDAPDDLVLNGFMLSLKGLWIYSSLTGDERASSLLEDGLTTLEDIVELYDTGDWSLYSNLHGPATERYHRLHVRLLYFLGAACHRERLVEEALEWDGYLVASGRDSEIPRAVEQARFWTQLISELSRVGGGSHVEDSRRGEEEGTRLESSRSPGPGSGPGALRLHTVRLPLPPGDKDDVLRPGYREGRHGLQEARRPRLRRQGQGVREVDRKRISVQRRSADIGRLLVQSLRLARRDAPDNRGV
ncbi:MAG: hypothetical protein DRO06_00230 [Thermoproteota archaeon]|nr:MAG: hypothetical protein DRO06_00230 [Candidatus Korarchaeota archaeon]